MKNELSKRIKNKNNIRRQLLVKVTALRFCLHESSSGLDTEPLKNLQFMFLAHGEKAVVGFEWVAIITVSSANVLRMVVEFCGISAV